MNSISCQNSAKYLYIESVYVFANAATAISSSFNCKENETNTIIYIEYDLLL